jgi:hypothetical protein
VAYRHSASCHLQEQLRASCLEDQEIRGLAGPSGTVVDCTLSAGADSGADSGAVAVAGAVAAGAAAAAGAAGAAAGGWGSELDQAANEGSARVGRHLGSHSCPRTWLSRALSLEKFTSDDDRLAHTKAGRAGLGWLGGHAWEKTGALDVEKGP